MIMLTVDDGFHQKFSGSHFLQDTDPFSASAQPGAWPELYSSDVSWKMPRKRAWVHWNYSILPGLEIPQRQPFQITFS